MNLEIYNLTMGYRSKDDYAEHIAYYYGRNVYRSSELFESEHIYEPILSMSDDIAKFSFETYNKQSSNPYNYVESRPFWINDMKFYTNWNFHSIDDILRDAMKDYHNNRPNKNKFFYKDSNRKIGHPIFIRFVSRNDFTTTVARNEFREIVSDKKFKLDFKKAIEILYSSEILITINFDWFYNNIIKQNESQEVLENILSSYLSHELIHVFDQYLFFSKNNLDTPKNSMLFDVQRDKDMENNFYNVWYECKSLMYYLYDAEERAFLHGATKFLERITTEENSIRLDMIEQARHIPDSFETIDVNKQLTHIVLSNTYFNKISYVGQFKDKISDLKTMADSDTKKKIIVLIGYYLFKYHKLNFTSNKIAIHISKDKARQFFSRESVCNFLTDMSFDPMLGVTVSEFIDFVMLNIENIFINYEMKVVRLIWKYINKIFNDKHTKVHFDRDYPKNTTVEVEDIAVLEDPDPDYLSPEDDKPNSSDEDSSDEYNYVKI